MYRSWTRSRTSSGPESRAAKPRLRDGERRPREIPYKGKYMINGSLF